MMKVLHLESTTFRKIYALCGWGCVSGWAHASTYAYVEARGWYQLCSSVHFHFIFLHLGFSLNQLNRTDRKPSDLLSLFLQFWDYRYTTAHDFLHGCCNLNSGSQACAVKALN